MLITCSQQSPNNQTNFSNYLINKLLINENSMIIQRLYVVALVIFRVNVVSILSMLEQVYAHVYIYSLQIKLWFL